jgi:FecR-like protein
MAIPDRALRDYWVLSVALGVTALVCLAPAASLAQPRELPAVIVTLGGRAEISRKAAPAWKDAVLRDELFEGDSVRTVAGRLTLLTSSSQAMRLGPRTQVSFEEAGAPSDSAPVRVRLDGGRVWIAVLPGSSAASQLEVRTGPVTVIARGGGALVTRNPDGSVLVGVYHGGVVCEGTGWERALRQDQELLVPPAGAPKELAVLKRDKRDADWIRWNEQQDMAGGYGARRAEP